MDGTSRKGKNGSKLSYAGRHYVLSFVGIWTLTVKYFFLEIKTFYMFL